MKTATSIFEDEYMKRKLLILLSILLLVPCITSKAQEISLKSGTKVNGTYAGAGEEDYNYYMIKSSSSDFIAVSVKTSDGANLLFDICDENKQVIASEISVPNKGTVYHKASKGKTYFLRVKGTEGVTYTLSYTMKKIDQMKYAKKYNFIFTNASFVNEDNAVLFKIKVNYSGIVQLMFDTDNELNVRFFDKNKKTPLSEAFTVNDHAFSGIGAKAGKTIYVKLWNAAGTNVGVTTIKSAKYQIKSITAENGGTRAKARRLTKGKYATTLVLAGKATTSWYRVNVSKKQRVSFTVESRMLQNNGAGLQLYICNSKGKKLNTAPIIVDGETTVIYKKKYKMEYPVKTFGTTAQFPKGTYYLKVVSKTKTSSGAYRIKWE